VAFSLLWTAAPETTPRPARATSMSPACRISTLTMELWTRNFTQSCCVTWLFRRSHSLSFCRHSAATLASIVPSESRRVRFCMASGQGSRDRSMAMSRFFVRKSACSRLWGSAPGAVW